MILFYDTETTGKADFKAAPDAKHQPRLVQLAAILADQNSGDEAASINLIIRPADFEIPVEASNIHGITTERAMACGVPLAHALSLWSSLSKISTLHCCHNTDFDTLIMAGECVRMVTEFHRRTVFCTMKEMTPVCGIPGPHGPKWPRLQEAYRHCFDKEFKNAHDALADVRACKDVYFWLKNKPATIPAL